MANFPVSSALPIKIAVIGSCVTRDVFNSKFCPNYKLFFECGASLIQGSIISFVSDRFLVPDEELSGLKSSSAKDIRSEMTREVNSYISDSKPEYAIFDFFGDVRFGAAQLDTAAFVTRNEWKLCTTNYYQQHVLKEFLPKSEEYFEMWAEAVDEAVRFIRRVSPNTKLVLHDVEFVTDYSTNDGDIKTFGNSASLRELNTWWRKLNSYFAENYADEVICVRTKETRSFEAHPWGAYGVHYELDYHAEFLSELTRMALVHSRTLRE